MTFDQLYIVKFLHGQMPFLAFSFIILHLTAGNRNEWYINLSLVFTLQNPETRYREHKLFYKNKPNICIDYLYLE